MQIGESGDTSIVNKIFSEKCEYVDIPNSHVLKGIAGVKDDISHIHIWGSNIKLEIRKFLKMVVTSNGRFLQKNLVQLKDEFKLLP